MNSSSQSKDSFSQEDPVTLQTLLQCHKSHGETRPRWDQTSGRHWQAAVASLCCFSNADFSGASRAMAMGSPLVGGTARSPKSEPKPQLTPRSRKESKPILINTSQSRKAHTKVLHLPHVVLHPSRDITGRSKKSLGITNRQAFSFQGCF